MTGGSMLRIAAVALLATLLLAPLLPACPLCKDAKSDTDYPGGAASLPKGFYYSILLMVSAPFAVAGGLVLRIVLARRRARGLTTSLKPEETPGERSSSPLVPDPRGAQP